MDMEEEEDIHRECDLITQQLDAMINDLDNGQAEAGPSKKN